jgi:hypothetical protein
VVEEIEFSDLEKNKFSENIYTSSFKISMESIAVCQG